MVRRDKKDSVRQEADEIRRRTGVKMVRMSIGSARGQLVSIIGPKERLEQAEKLLKQAAS